MIIRVATAADVPAVVDIHLVSWDAAKEGLDLPTRRSVEERTEQWEGFLREARGSLILACDPEPVGFIAYGASRDDDRRGEFEVYQLYVVPERWSTGVGSALLGHVPHGVPVSLWVSERNDRARGFYARHGFAPDGAREPGHHVPAVRMAREAC